jgi:hypothetical protein
MWLSVPDWLWLQNMLQTQSSGELNYGHGISVLQAYPTSTRHPRANSTVPGMEDYRQFCLSEDFVQRIREGIIGDKFLDRRM